MFNRFSLILATLAMTLGFSQTNVAAEASAETATIVVYRAEERNKTKRIKLQLQINDSTVSALPYNEALVTTVPAGRLTLNTSIKGTQSLVIDVKPGQTHYVYAHVKSVGYTLVPTMSEVAENVAMAQQPAIGEVI